MRARTEPKAEGESKHLRKEAARKKRDSRKEGAWKRGRHRAREIGRFRGIGAERKADSQIFKSGEISREDVWENVCERAIDSGKTNAQKVRRM